MDYATQNKVQYWNRKLTNACWLIVLFSVIIELLMYLVSTSEFRLYLYNSVIIPTRNMLVIMICSEIAIRFFKKFTDYINISTCLLLSSTLFWVHVSVPPINAILFLPFIISIFYFKINRVVFACVTTIITTYFLYSYHHHFIGENRLLYLFSAISMISFAFFVALSIMKRGIELPDDLRKTMSLQQELLVKNIMMDRASKIDALTECYNHKTFHEYLDKLIGHCEGDDVLFHLSIIDIDNFKKVNDTYGHWAGDIVLKSVARVIKDSAASNDFVARYGGEEFAVISIDKTLEESYQILENMRLQVANIKYPELEGQSVTVSIGLHSYAKGVDKETLFKGADYSLYVSKKTGKNKITANQ